MELLRAALLSRTRAVVKRGLAFLVHDFRVSNHMASSSARATLDAMAPKWPGIKSLLIPRPPRPAPPGQEPVESRAYAFAPLLFPDGIG